MSNYTKATNFATKDTLSTGDANKIVKGTEIDNEFNAISGAISSKADIAGPTFTGTPSAPTATAGTSTTQLATTAFVTAALQAVYPVGSIYINAASSSNPSSLLGFGTWTEFGAGRVMVGLNASDASFDTLEETGGSKDTIVVSHTHTATSTVTETAHTHFIMEGAGYAYSYANTATPGQSLSNGLNDGGAASYLMGGPNSTTGQPKANFGLSSATATGATVATTNASTGASGTNANLQPYITVKMWKRTA
jgi:hypothetical protein